MLLVVLQGTGEWSGQDTVKECKSQKEVDSFINSELSEYDYDEMPNVKVYEAKEIKRH